jgi:hypothetical protein
MELELEVEISTISHLKSCRDLLSRRSKCNTYDASMLTGRAHLRAM